MSGEVEDGAADVSQSPLAERTPTEGFAGNVQQGGDKRGDRPCATGIVVLKCRLAERENPSMHGRLHESVAAVTRAAHSVVVRRDWKHGR
jgi:hypothetical protein